VLGRTYEREVCSAARALEIAGERWSLLVLRNAAFAGHTRFTEFQESLGIAPNILAARLEHFVADGIMSVTDGPGGHPEYRLTNKGVDFKPVIIALTQWGDRWAAPEGPPVVYEHNQCGGHVSSRLYCDKCGKSPARKDVVARSTEVLERERQRRRLARSRPRSRR
jgi:DNA-binding HxlR family transcriptional regulator